MVGTWTVGLFLAGSLALGSGVGQYALPGSLDEGLGLPEEPVGSLDLGPLDEVASQVDEGVSAVVAVSEDLIEPVLDPVEEIVDPIVEPVLDPLIDDLVDPILDPIVEDPVDPNPDPLPEEGSGRSPASQPATDPTSPRSDGDAGPAVSPVSLPDRPIFEPSAPFIDQTAVPGRAAGDDSELRDERLIPLLEAGRFRSPTALPIEPGSTLSGILAWLSSGPAIIRVLAAPMELLWVLARALVSAGSGLIAPFSLLVALIVRQVREARRSSPVAG